MYLKSMEPEDSTDRLQRPHSNRTSISFKQNTHNLLIKSAGGGSNVMLGMGRSMDDIRIVARNTMMICLFMLMLEYCTDEDSCVRRRQRTGAHTLKRSAGVNSVRRDAGLHGAWHAVGVDGTWPDCGVRMYASPAVYCRPAPSPELNVCAGHTRQLNVGRWVELLLPRWPPLRRPPYARNFMPLADAVAPVYAIPPPPSITDAAAPDLQN